MKSGMIRKHFGVNVPDSEEISNPFQAAQHLGKLGYKNVHLVLGGDRVKDIGGMIKKYMGHEDPEKRIDISNHYYNFEVTLHSAGVYRSVDKVSVDGAPYCKSSSTLRQRRGIPTHDCSRFG